MSNQLRDALAEQFVKALSENRLPWRSMWATQRPYNATTENDYRGVNALWLSYQAGEKGYTDPRWCTFKQAKDNGWSVKKGEKGTLIEFWSAYDTKTRKALSLEEVDKIVSEDPERREDMRVMAKHYTVFNAQQINGIPQLATQNTEIDIAAIRGKRDTLINNMGLTFREGGDRAFYRPSEDSITMPPENAFKNDYGYMSVFLHECGHATGAPHRLNRDLSGTFGSESYAKEELRAEIASAFTSQALGIDAQGADQSAVMDNHKAYIQSWAKAIKDAPNELFNAIKDAEKISDYLIEKGQFDRVPKAPELVDPEVEKKVIAGIEAEFVRDEDRSLYEALVESCGKEYPFLSPIEKSCLAASILPDEDIIRVGRSEMAKELYELMSIDEEHDCTHLAPYFDCEAIVAEARESWEMDKEYNDRLDPDDEDYNDKLGDTFEEYMEAEYGVSEYDGTTEQRAVALLNAGAVSREQYFNHDKYLLGVVNGDVVFGPSIVLNRQTGEAFTIPNMTSDNKWIDAIVDRAEKLQKNIEKEMGSLDGKINAAAQIGAERPENRQKTPEWSR